MGKRKNLTGCRFGRLTVIRYTGERVDGNAVWECVCDCGGVKKTTAKNLLSGGTKSCGCLQKEKASKVARTINDRLMQSKETEHPSYKHGESRTRLYGIWLHMNDRTRHIRIMGDAGFPFVRNGATATKPSAIGRSQTVMMTAYPSTELTRMGTIRPEIADGQQRASNQATGGAMQDVNDMFALCVSKPETFMKV